MNTDYQPEAPEVPGAPGLWFCTDSGPDKGVRRVITKIQDRTAKYNNKWLYVGQYEILAAKPLTVKEWEAQSTLVRLGLHPNPSNCLLTYVNHGTSLVSFVKNGRRRWLAAAGVRIYVFVYMVENSTIETLLSRSMIRSRPAVLTKTYPKMMSRKHSP